MSRSRQHVTITSRDFAHNPGPAKRAAAAGGTVFITDRGEPAFALLNIAEYRRITGASIDLVSFLELPALADSDFDFSPIRLAAQSIDD